MSPLRHALPHVLRHALAPVLRQAPVPGRRPLLAALLGSGVLGSGLASMPLAALALPARTLVFPRDHGAHPERRTEGWYITGQARSGERGFGFQLTFFRARVEAAQALASRFAARQLMFAHAAVTDLQGQRLWHEQRIARAGFGIAQASENDTDVRLRDWSLARQRDGRYLARLPAGDFSIVLDFTPTQPVLLQGEAGLSRKGPLQEQASYYYSQPQLMASGRLGLKDRGFDVTGRAWLDHEWSDAYLAREAVGWDWLGMNLDDGSALMAFRIRRADSSALWDGGSFRPPGQPARAFGAGQTRLLPGRQWTSPSSGARYPVEWTLDCPAGRYTVRALLDAQELDSRASTGAIYWEGLSDLLDASGRRVGRGYLEMTGYAGALRM